MKSTDLEPMEYEYYCAFISRQPLDRDECEVVQRYLADACHEALQTMVDACARREGADELCRAAEAITDGKFPYYFDEDYRGKAVCDERVDSEGIESGLFGRDMPTYFKFWWKFESWSALVEPMEKVLHARMNEHVDRAIEALLKYGEPSIEAIRDKYYAQYGIEPYSKENQGFYLGELGDCQAATKICNGRPVDHDLLCLGGIFAPDSQVKIQKRIVELEAEVKHALYPITREEFEDDARRSSNDEHRANPSEAYLHFLELVKYEKDRNSPMWQKMQNWD